MPKKAEIKFLSLKDNERTPMEMPAAAIYCLGNFDGVHIAHRALFDQALRIKNEKDNTALAGVLVFYAPSSDYFPSLETGKKNHLTTLDTKLELFARAGLDFVALVDFSDIMDMPPCDFLDFLKVDASAVGIVCGYNYSFGKGAAGHPELISEYFSDDLSFSVSIIPEMKMFGLTVSSTQIRTLIASGDMENASALLGYRYFLSSTVLHGKALGSQLGSATANQVFPDDMQIPAHGVYVTLCHIDGKPYPAVTNVGVRPTVEGTDKANCETHILDFEGNIYGKTVCVEFLKMLRTEKKFSDVVELKAAIAYDLSAARNYFKSNKDF